MSGFSRRLPASDDRRSNSPPPPVVSDCSCIRCGSFPAAGVPRSSEAAHGAVYQRAMGHASCELSRRSVRPRVASGDDHLQAVIPDFSFAWRTNLA